MEEVISTQTVSFADVSHGKDFGVGTVISLYHVSLTSCWALYTFVLNSAHSPS